MRVYKFGGASVRDAKSVRNVGQILLKNVGDPLCIILSAMGKTTNSLEDLCQAYLERNEIRVQEIFSEIKQYHLAITKDLEVQEGVEFFEVDNLFIELESLLDSNLFEQGEAFVYDQIICFGELLSTRIVSSYLNKIGVNNRWLDARNIIYTNSEHKRASIQWHTTENIIQNRVKRLVERQNIITQGFIGRSETNNSTTLGREGSDYSAAVFAYGLNAESVTIWKDVVGVMNADPKLNSQAQLIPELSYEEAIELAFYGAKVIHPKTIQPLKTKKIPLYVQSFVDFNSTGTVVKASDKRLNQLPSYIFKEKQVLLSLQTRDYSFIVENHISEIFNILAQYGLEANLIQNSAVSFAVCMNDSKTINEACQELERDFQLDIIKDLSLLTIYNYQSNGQSYNETDFEKLVEQKNGYALQLVLKPKK